MIPHTQIPLVRGLYDTDPPAPSWLKNDGSGVSNELNPGKQAGRGALAPPSPVGVSDAGMQKMDSARVLSGDFHHVSVSNCVSTAVDMALSTVPLPLDQEERGAVKMVLMSLALPIVARRTTRVGVPLFTNKEFGRFTTSLRQTATTLAVYSQADDLKGGVKYHLDVILAKVFHDSQPVPVPTVISSHPGNLFTGWIGTCIKRALHRRDIPFIYSLTKGSPQAWPPAPDNLIYRAFEKHRRLLGTPKAPSPPEVLDKIKNLMIRYFPSSELPPGGPEASFLSPDTGPPHGFPVPSDRPVPVDSFESSWLPTGRACRQAGRPVGGGLSLIPKCPLWAPESGLRGLDALLVDWRERGYLASQIQFRGGIQKFSMEDRKNFKILRESYEDFFGKLRENGITSLRELRQWERRDPTVTALIGEEERKGSPPLAPRERFFPASTRSFEWRQEPYDGTPGGRRSSFFINDVKAVALCEAGFKVRVITLGDGPTNSLLQPLQGYLLSHWKRTPWSTMASEDADLTGRVGRIFRSWHTFLGEGMAPERWARLHKEARRRYEDLRSFFDPAGPHGMFWMSGDFEAATDNLKPDVTLKAISQITGPYSDLALASFLPGRVTYYRPMGGRVPPPVQMESGQLMGHPLSFPLLCVINAAAFLVAVDRWVQQGHTEDKNPSIRLFYKRWVYSQFLVNGDDILAYIPQSLYPIWQESVNSVGLIPSKGKNFLSRDCCQINSQVFQEVRGSVIRHGYLNQRLVRGVSVKNGDAIASPVEVARELNKVANLVPWTASTWPLAMSRWSDRHWSPVVRGVPVSPNWYLPVHLGGYGLDPRFGPADVRVSTLQRVLAARFSQPESAGKIALYRMTRGVKSLLACKLAQDLGVVRLKFGDYVPLQSEELVRDSSSGWFGRFTYYARAREQAVPMGDRKLAAIISNGDWRIEPMSDDTIIALWKAQLFTNASLPPLTPLPPPVPSSDRRVPLGFLLHQVVFLTRFFQAERSEQDLINYQAEMQAEEDYLCYNGARKQRPFPLSLESPLDFVSDFRSLMKAVFQMGLEEF